MKYFFIVMLFSGLVAGCSPSSDDGKGGAVSGKPAVEKPSVTSKAGSAPPTAGLKPVAPGVAAAPGEVSGKTLVVTDVVLDSFDVGPDVYVRALMVDKDGNALWVGTSAGVMEIGLDGLGMRHTFTRADGLANEYVFAIGQDREGYQWFGTNAGGASRYKDGQWKTYFPMHGLADYWIYSFAQHPDGSFWIGTWAGVNRMDLDSGHMETFVSELVNEWVYAMVVDAKNRIWFGTEGGISRLDGQDWQAWTHKDGLGGENSDHLEASTNTGLGTRRRHDLGIFNAGAPTYNPNYVFSLVMESADVVWAGTWGGGVSRFDGKKWTSYTQKDGLPGNVVYSLAMDQKGRIWAGTDNGIGVFEGGKWRTVPHDKAFMNQHFYAIIATPSGEIWAGTRGKVVRIGDANAKKE